MRSARRVHRASEISERKLQRRSQPKEDRADTSGPFAGQVFFNPQPGSVGSLQRRILSGPWFNNYNFNVIKDIHLTERRVIQFRADFYNLFNHHAKERAPHSPA